MKAYTNQATAGIYMFACLLIISCGVERNQKSTTTATAFLIHTKHTFYKKQSPNTSSTKLNDLSEWRDQFFEVSKKVKNDITELVDDEEVLNEPIREICVLPFPLDDVLLQGETKELCLYEDRFHQLFETSTKCHNSVVAMGLLAPPAGILQNMPLCEIENYRVMQGQTAFGTDFSILVTIRVVGRASLLYIQDSDEDDVEFLRGYCVEVNDEDSDKDAIEIGNQLADKMDGMITEIQILEEKVMDTTSSGKVGKSIIDSVDALNDASMKRRILEAELVSLLFESLIIGLSSIGISYINFIICNIPCVLAAG